MKTQITILALTALMSTAAFASNQSQCLTDVVSALNAGQDPYQTVSKDCIDTLVGSGLMQPAPVDEKLNKEQCHANLKQDMQVAFKELQDSFEDREFSNFTYGLGGSLSSKASKAEVYVAYEATVKIRRGSKEYIQHEVGKEDLDVNCRLKRNPLTGDIRSRLSTTPVSIKLN